MIIKKIQDKFLTLIIIIYYIPLKNYNLLLKLHIGQKFVTNMLNLEKV